MSSGSARRGGLDVVRGGIVFRGGLAVGGVAFASFLELKSDIVGEMLFRAGGVVVGSPGFLRVRISCAVCLKDLFGSVVYLFRECGGIELCLLFALFCCFEGGLVVLLRKYDERTGGSSRIVDGKKEGFSDMCDCEGKVGDILRCVERVVLICWDGWS